MWPFGSRAKLVRALDSLAFYNDKGSSYAKHSPQQVQAERGARIARIRELVEQVGATRILSGFLVALESGEVATDLTGQYAAAVKAHFRSGSAL